MFEIIKKIFKRSTGEMSRISKNNYDLNEMILYMKKENLKIKKFI
jgi:hypothetical protein